MKIENIFSGKLLDIQTESDYFPDTEYEGIDPIQTDDGHVLVKTSNLSRRQSKKSGMRKIRKIMMKQSKK